MISEIPKILLNIAIIFGGVTIISLTSVGLMIGFEKIADKWKGKKKK